MYRDSRHAARQLRRSPGFTAAVALTLAIGIGATTTVFSLVDAILLKPLSYRQSDRLVVIGHTAPGLNLDEVGISDGSYLHYRDESRSFDGIAMYYENAVNLSGGEGDAERVPIAMVSRDFFNVLGARTVHGRLPTAEDLVSGGEVVVLISHGLWQRRYGSDPGIVGANIEANRVPRRVIGVLEPGFDFPRRETAIWYPSADPTPGRARAADFSQLSVARLAPGVTTDLAQRELNQLIRLLPAAYPDIPAEVIEQGGMRAVVRPLKDVIVGDVRAALWLLLGGMTFLLLIACANVANLVLVRGEYRQKEIAVRAALGARRGDLARLFASESIILATLGGALGLFLADWAVPALMVYGPRNLPRLTEVRVDLRIVVFTAALSALTALLFAFVPLIRSARSPVHAVLKERGSGVTPGTGRHRVRRVLVMAQVALALTLMVGSALMVQSFWRLQRADPGFDRAGVITAEISLPHSGYETYERSQLLWDALLERISALPGVQQAGIVGGVPLVPRPAYHDFALEIADRSGELHSATTLHHVTTGYFEAMRIPVVEGRSLETGAHEVERPVLLSAAAAQKLFPGESAVGKRLRRAVTGMGHAHARPAPWWTVIGVVGDVPKQQIGGDPSEIVYLPVLEYAVDPGLWPSQVTLVARTLLEPAALQPAIREIVRELDPQLPLANVRTMQGIVDASMARTSLTMLLLIVAAAGALALGALGLYAVISYTIKRRTHEFGIRIALGAVGADLRRMVLRESGRLAMHGVVVGLVAALALTRLLRGVLYEVSPGDPLTLGATLVLLLSVVFVTSGLAARRATTIEPMSALKVE